MSQHMPITEVSLRFKSSRVSVSTLTYGFTEAQVLIRLSLGLENEVQVLLRLTLGLKT